MEQSHTRPFAGIGNPIARLRSAWSAIQQARKIATEFAALNALSDAELHRMGLTRAVLRRHLKQKHSTQVLLAPSGGWHDGSAADHSAGPR